RKFFTSRHVYRSRKQMFDFFLISRIGIDFIKKSEKFLLVFLFFCMKKIPFGSMSSQGVFERFLSDQAIDDFEFFIIEIKRIPIFSRRKFIKSQIVKISDKKPVIRIVQTQLFISIINFLTVTIEICILKIQTGVIYSSISFFL